MKEVCICQGEHEIHVQVIRSARKTIGLEIRGEDEVWARIPSRLSDQELMKFIEKHKEWIMEKTALVKKRKDEDSFAGIVPMEKLSEEELQNIKEKIVSRVRHYCEVMGVTVGKITIRNQKTRWGSCSAKGNVNFNYRLCYLSEELLDYVVIHELAHRRYMDHSREFWAEVEKYCPDYKQRKKQLKSL